MAFAYWAGDSINPSQSLKGMAQFVRNGAGAWVPKGGGIIVKDFTFSSNTDAHASGDVIAAPEELTGLAPLTGGDVRLIHAVLYDLTDQAQNVQIVFLNASGSIGAESAAFAPADGVAETCVGQLLFSSHSDFINSNVFFETGLNLLMRTGVDGSLWAGLICREGTPTYAADGLKVKLYFEQA